MTSSTFTDHRSDSVSEQLFVGAVLPTVGLLLPADSQRDNNALGDADIFHYRSAVHGEEVAAGLSQAPQRKKTTVNELRRCHPVDIEFESIAVDVKVTLPPSDEELQKQTASCRTVQWLYHAIKDGLGCGGSGPTVTKRILHDVSGTIHRKKLVALMGASGAGKSTLLNVLSGRRDQSAGTVKLNGENVTRSKAQNCSAFVQQVDLFLSNLTTDEHLNSQLELRLPSGTSKSARNKRADILFDEMSLAKCRYTVIGPPGGLGGLSGGERKRLNVASELARLPSVLFADEPTTGLDSCTAASVVSILRRLADSGRTVIATIHQPRSSLFEMFDEVVLLAEGRLIYAGHRLACLTWLQRFGYRCPPYCNPADFIIKVVSVSETGNNRTEKLQQLVEWSELWKKEGVDFIKHWEQSGKQKFIEDVNILAESQYASFACSRTGEKDVSFLPPTKEGNVTSSNSESGAIPLDAEELPETGDEGTVVKVENEDYDLLSADPMKSQGPGWFRQIGILYKRALHENRRNKMLVHARAMQTLFLGVVIGLLFFRLDWTLTDTQARLGGLHTLLLNQSMSGAFAVMNTFVLEKPIIRREYESGLLYPSAHMVAKMLADFLVQVLFPIIFATITYWMMGLNDDIGRFLAILVIVFFVSNAAMSIGYFASAVSSSPDTAAVVCNLSVLPLTVFGGFMVKLSDSPKWLSWIQVISFVKHGFFGGAVILFRNETVYRSETDTVDGLDFIYYGLGITERSLGVTIGVLLLLLIIYRMIAGIGFTLAMRWSKQTEA